MLLTRRAIRSDWPIPAGARGQIVSEMVRLVFGGASDRVRIGAAKVLIAADAVNVRRESLDLQLERQKPSVTDPEQRRVLIFPSNGRESVSMQQRFKEFDAMEPEYQEWMRRRELEFALGKPIDFDRNRFQSKLVGPERAEGDE